MPQYPHRIRLRGPWECVPIEAHGGAILPMPRRVTMPGRFGDHGLAAFAGQVRYTRTFGYPGTIDDFERVWLTCDGMDGRADVLLNDVCLARQQSGPFAFDGTAVLKPHNRLDLTLAAAGEQAGLWGEVALEVRCTAYLRDMQVRRQDDGTVQVSGLAAGSCDGLLELYGIANGAQAHYQHIEPRQKGRRSGSWFRAESFPC